MRLLSWFGKLFHSSGPAPRRTHDWMLPQRIAMGLLLKDYPPGPPPNQGSGRSQGKHHMMQHALDQVLADTRFWRTQARTLYCLAHGCGPWEELTDARRAAIDAEFERARLNQSRANTLAQRGPADIDPPPVIHTEIA